MVLKPCPFNALIVWQGKTEHVLLCIKKVRFYEETGLIQDWALAVPMYLTISISYNPEVKCDFSTTSSEVIEFQKCISPFLGGETR